LITITRDIYGIQRAIGVWWLVGWGSDTCHAAMTYYHSDDIPSSVGLSSRWNDVTMQCWLAGQVTKVLSAWWSAHLAMSRVHSPARHVVRRLFQRPPHIPAMHRSRRQQFFWCFFHFCTVHCATKLWQQRI